MSLLFGVQMNEPWRHLWNSSASEGIDCVLWTGDIGTFGEPEAYALAAAPEGPMTRVERVGAIGTIPVFSVPGNHDYIRKHGTMLPYRSRDASAFTDHFQPIRGPDVHSITIKGMRFQFFRIDTSSADLSFFRVSKGKIGKRDLERIKELRRLLRVGGTIDDQRISRDDVVNSWNLLLMHHELENDQYYRDIYGDKQKDILKLLAGTPIHVVACGHVHSADADYFELWGPGRLNTKQIGALKENGFSPSRRSLVSRAGTACCSKNTKHSVNVLEFKHDSCAIRTFDFSDGNFREQGEPKRLASLADLFSKAPGRA